MTSIALIKKYLKKIPLLKNLENGILVSMDNA